jgi:thiol-disulfide isomerase/thioredoxin
MFVSAAAASLVVCLMLGATACSNDGASKKAAMERRAAREGAGSGTVAPRTALPMPPAQTAEQTAASESGWTLLDGRRAKLSDFRGQVLVLDFYATYCPPCRDEIPHLNTLQRRYATEGVNVVGLNVGGAEDYPKVPQFVAELNISYPLGNPDAGFSEPFFTDNSSIPQTYVFDRRGRLVRRFVGFDPSMPAELETAIKTALETKTD